MFARPIRGGDENPRHAHTRMSGIRVEFEFFYFDNFFKGLGNFKTWIV